MNQEGNIRSTCAASVNNIIEAFIFYLVIFIQLNVFNPNCRCIFQGSLSHIEDS